MSVLKDRLVIHISSVTELLSAMHRIVNHERVYEVKEYGDHVSKEVERWVVETRKKIPAEMLEELKTFFNNESYLGLTLIPDVINRNAYSDIHSFLTLLHDLPLEDLFRAFTHSGFGPDQELTKFDNPKEVVDFLEKLNFPKEEKWKIAYMIFDGSRTKERLIQLVQSFYYRFFQEYEELALKKQKEFVNQIEKDISTGEENSIRELITRHGGEIRDFDRIIIFPSFYTDTGIVYMLLKSLNLTAVVLGLRHFELASTFRGEKETLDAVKVLIDERRFQVLQLLKKQPCYGYELAQALGVSNSTISHHLSSLISQKFVRAIRRENKVYYEVNPAEIKQVIQQLQKMFIDE